jgi:hypothetical protein
MDILYLPLVPDEGSQAFGKIETDHGNYLYEFKLTAKSQGKENPVVFETTLGKTETQNITVYNSAQNAVEFTVEVSFLLNCFHI